jgi:hypothetical protein
LIFCTTSTLYTSYIDIMVRMAKSTTSRDLASTASKARIPTTSPKARASTTAPKAQSSTTTSKAQASTTTSKDQASIASKAQTSTPKTRTSSTAPKVQSSTTTNKDRASIASKVQTSTPKARTSSTAPKAQASTITTKSRASSTAPKAQAPTITANAQAPTITAKAQAPTITAKAQAPTITTKGRASTTTPKAGASTNAHKGGGIHGRQCKFYVNGQPCPFVSRRGGCWNIHDLEARQANLAKLSALNQRNVTQFQQSQSQAVVPTQDSNHVALRILPEMITPGFAEYLSNPNPVVELPYGLQPPGLPHLSTKAEDYQDGQVFVSTNDHSTAPSSPVSQKSSTAVGDNSSSISEPFPVESAPEQHWDFANHYGRWASLNLTPETAAKYLRDINKGRVPRELLSTSSEAPTTVNGAATTFHQFTELPFELRDQIWRQAIMAQDGRTCRVSFFVDYDTLGRPIERKILPMGKAPTFFLVNTESRTIAKQMYKCMKAFGTPDYPAGTCYFNFNVDRLFLNLKNSKEYGPVRTFSFIQSR